MDCVDLVHAKKYADVDVKIRNMTDSCIPGRTRKHELAMYKRKYINTIKSNSIIKKTILL